MPRIRVLAGPSPTSLSPITANDGRGHPIKSSSFEGEISVFLKDFVNEKGQVPHTDYFNHESRTGCTWSIQARGKLPSGVLGGVCDITVLIIRDI